MPLPAELACFNSLFGILAVQTSTGGRLPIQMVGRFNSLFGILAVQTYLANRVGGINICVSIPCSEFWLFRPSSPTEWPAPTGWFQFPVRNSGCSDKIAGP